MSKVPLRARALDVSKPMPVFSADQLADLSEYAACNRALAQMPTGVDKEEEMELHLQQALSAQQASTTGGIVAEAAYIPVPEVTVVDKKVYERLHPESFLPSKQLLKVQAALNLEPEIPDYDIDEEDERFLAAITGQMEISQLQFETIMDRLEKASEHQVIKISEAKSVIPADDDIIVTVYDYWMEKRLSTKMSLIPRVKYERREGGPGVNPYVAFRRRAERMQTRKNRKNDEDSFVRILKLSQDLKKAVTLLHMIQRREKTKREIINLEMEVFDRRFQLEDWKNEIYTQILQQNKPSFQFNHRDEATHAAGMRKKRDYKKRKHPRKNSVGVEVEGVVSREWLAKNAEEWNRLLYMPSPSTSSSPHHLHKRGRSDSMEVDGPYAFKRSRGCVYHAPHPRFPRTSVPLNSGSRHSDPHSQTQPQSQRAGTSGDHNYERTTPLWPWENPTLHPYLSPTPAAFHSSGGGGLRFVGAVRARRGRGGRLIFDRQSVPTPSCEQYLRREREEEKEVEGISPPVRQTLVGTDSSTRESLLLPSISTTLDTGDSQSPSPDWVSFYRPPTPVPPCKEGGWMDSLPLGNHELTTFLHSSSLSSSAYTPNGPFLLVEGDTGTKELVTAHVGTTHHTYDTHRAQILLQKAHSERTRDAPLQDSTGPSLPSSTNPFPQSSTEDMRSRNSTSSPNRVSVKNDQAYLATSAVVSYPYVYKLIQQQNLKLANAITYASSSSGNGPLRSRFNDAKEILDEHSEIMKWEDKPPKNGSLSSNSAHTPSTSPSLSRKHPLPIPPNANGSFRLGSSHKTDQILNHSSSGGEHEGGGGVGGVSTGPAPQVLELNYPLTPSPSPNSGNRPPFSIENNSGGGLGSSKVASDMVKAAVAPHSTATVGNMPSLAISPPGVTISSLTASTKSGPSNVTSNGEMEVSSSHPRFQQIARTVR